ncbi:MAG: aldo/keto reductase [Clostridiales Family XIII bacterium]|nr:aldo/keto reductase [Clostridiales Family XIII bacterium]
MPRVKRRKMGRAGEDVSILGYGCMRFPRKRGGIDMAKTEAQILSGIERGINYFDTAYIYPGSEKALGSILAGGWRDKVNIATKLPVPSIKRREDMDAIFDIQAERLRTGHIDYYLIHNITSFAEWEGLKALGATEFIEGLLKSGRIRHIGFSSHGNLMDFKRIVDDYPWEFCQIQFNYIDENFQAGRAGLEYASQRGLGVIAMEPLRGGMLTGRMPAAARRLIDGFAVRRTPAEWALRWVWGHEGISLLLSGMNAMEQVAENTRIASEAEAHSLTAEELELISRLRDAFREATKVGCTGCAYCMPCPQGVNIPQCFAQYNNRAMFGGIQPYIEYAMYLDGFGGRPPSRASACVKCGACEAKCPQKLPIMECLEETAAAMEKKYLSGLVRLGRKIVYHGLG